MKNIYLIIVLLWWVLFSINVFASAKFICQGKVMNESGNPILNVKVTLTVTDEGNYWGPKEATAYTDINGNYKVVLMISNWGAGTIGKFIVRAWGKEGYAQQYKDLTPYRLYVDKGFKTQYDFVLKRIAYDYLSNKRNKNKTYSKNGQREKFNFHEGKKANFTVQLMSVNSIRNTNSNYYRIKIFTRERGQIAIGNTIGATSKKQNHDKYFYGNPVSGYAMCKFINLDYYAGDDQFRFSVEIIVGGKIISEYWSAWTNPVTDPGMRQVSIAIGQ